jgi:hypothetical protein
MEKFHHRNTSQYIDILRNTGYWSFLVLLSVSSCISILLWLPKNSSSQWIFAGLVYILALTFVSLGLHKIIFRYARNRLNSYTDFWKIGFISACILGGLWLSFNIPIIPPPPDLNHFATTFIVKLVYKTSVGVAIGLALFLVITWLATSFTHRAQAANKGSLIAPSIKYALPISFIWGIYLLAFFPGMMSADSMVQWGQVLTGKFVDHHPAFHTFLMWLLTRIYLSPAVIAIAQIITLAFIAGLWFAFFESLGIRRWVIWSLTLIFALIPVNGTMVNTLWKDIPYSTAVLGLTLIIARIVVTKGAWIVSLSARIILGVTTALVLLLRHDGVIVGAGSLVLLIVVYPYKWKSWLVSCLICAFLYFGIRGPIYNWVGVEKSNTLSEASLSLYSRAAYAIQGSETDLLVSSIEILSPNWNCNIWTKVSPDRIQTDLNRSISTTQAMVNLLHRIPNILAYYGRCARSLEWIIWDPNGEVRNASHVEVLVDPNPYGIKPDSKIPAMRDWISKWVIKTSHDTNLNWFIWRPALFLYFNFFVSAVLIIRNHNLRFGLLSVPILIQTITFSLILAEPNFRYHYAVYLVSLISIPLLISPPITEIKDAGQGQTNES